MARDRDWLSAKQAADELNMRAETLCKHLNSGQFKLPYVRVGKQYRISRIALERHLHTLAHQNGETPAASAVPSEPLFKLGQRVEKYKGKYVTFGEVRSVFWSKAGELHYVVELEPQNGMMHIYDEKQLRLAP